MADPGILRALSVEEGAGFECVVTGKWSIWGNAVVRLSGELADFCTLLYTLVGERLLAISRPLPVA